MREMRENNVAAVLGGGTGGKQYNKGGKLKNKGGKNV
jgi:hypothetical protein